VDKAFINDEIKKAMREHDKTRLSILRLVKNEIDIREKETGTEPSDAEVTATLKKVLKQTGETLEGSIKAGTNPERTESLQHQVDILNAYLPKQVCGADLEAIVDRVLAETGVTEKRGMGQVISAVVAETGGNCDKAEVARMVGNRLS
jgi:uncharacterized protein YqeY